MEADFYYKHLEGVHKMILMHPAQSAFLLGIPFYIRRDGAPSLQFIKIQLGHFYGTIIHTRSQLLALIAHQEPHLDIIAEDDLGRTIYADNG